ncbi:nitrilase-related carbon-nitrogen hydrolase [Austwickia chelonae]|uniref:nitrilase-related carbon-nitrogen hydrolase n=1 Tax=Austwickia chelonae TaxID=100225 RepID=UPI000E251F0B|nr:nitrilase-related carbon-nitrogen hydrolase [Austwickia chelonae]
MKVAVVQLAYADDLPREEHRVRVADRVGRSGADVDLVVLPELWSVGAFTPRSWPERAEPVDGPTFSVMAAAAARAGCVLHAGTIMEELSAQGESAVRADSERADGRPGSGCHMANTAGVFGPDGSCLTTYRKIHTFGAAGVERDLVRPGEQVCVVDIPVPCPTSAETTVRVGLATCYDLRFPELFRLLAGQGAQMMLVSASWPAVRSEAWRILLQARAMENQVFVVGCGAAGVNGRTAMAGQSLVVGPDGSVLVEALGCSGSDGAPDATMTVDLDLAEVSRVREDFPVLPDRRLDRC